MLVWDLLNDAFTWVQDGLFETVVQPFMLWAGMADLIEKAYEGTGLFLVGALQIVVLLCVIGPLQRWRPVEPVRDKAAIRVDILYTLIHRLGLFKLAMFFTVQNWVEMGVAWARGLGMPTLHIDQIWPGVTDQAGVSFVIYLILFDFINYWYHRAQHQFNWWWALHAVHHSQRQLTMWSDNRNHLIDDMIFIAMMVIVAITVGVGPGQFVALIALTDLSQSLQHANVRLSFGPIGERLWVSPRFHHVHHSIGIGHESKGQGTLGGHNFGILLPWWDMLFGTADFQRGFEPTGIRDQVEPASDGRVRNYGRGFWAQQWLGLRRLVGQA